MPTGWAYCEQFLEHRTGPHHPERPDRLRAVVNGLREAGLMERLVSLPVEAAGDEWLLLNHSAAYLARLQRACRDGDPYIDTPDSAIGPASERIARRAAGAVVGACDAVMAGEIRNAFCAVRPPGHHARRERSAGFCLYNNVAIAARRLLTRHGLTHVMILDWDVHHGDGTQASFEERAEVLFVSLHEDPRYCYPGTGYAHETGRGAGAGFTLNLPMPPGATDARYYEAIEQVVLPRARQFAPQFLLISNGLDAHRDDPLAGINLSDECFAWMMRQARGLAEECCGGRVVAVLEGGYDLGVLARCAAQQVRILLDPSER